MKTAGIAWMAALSCLVSGRAHAAGDRTQGTYVCGRNLEILTSPGGPPSGDCLAVRTGNPTAGAMTLNDAASTTVTVTGCTDKGKYWDCQQGSFSNPDFCSAPAHVFVLKAKASLGSFDFSTDQTLTVVCGGEPGFGPQTPTCGKQPQESSGKAGDCILWGFEPTASDQRLFNACVRMARADYLGDGSTATRAGTHIQPGTPSSPCDCTDCQGCLEAYWNDRGALCIHHERWQRVTDGLARYFFAKYTTPGLKADKPQVHACTTLRCWKSEAERIYKKTFPKRVDYKYFSKLPHTKEHSIYKAAEAQWYDCREEATPESALLWNRSRKYSCPFVANPNPGTVAERVLSVSPCDPGAADPPCPQCPH